MLTNLFPKDVLALAREEAGNDRVLDGFNSGRPGRPCWDSTGCRVFWMDCGSLILSPEVEQEMYLTIRKTS